MRACAPACTSKKKGEARGEIRRGGGIRGGGWCITEDGYVRTGVIRFAEENQNQGERINISMIAFTPEIMTFI